jgi:ribosomal protein S18 acetylase RimI-like enzyme
MLIRKANLDDIEEMVALGAVFWEQTEYYREGCVYDPERCKILTEHLIHNGIVMIAVDGSKLIGMLLLAKCNNPFSGELMVGDFAFFVDEAYRRSSVGADLIISGMSEAQKQGAERMNMVFLHSVTPENAKRLYEKLGFKVAESTYTLKLS